MTKKSAGTAEIWKALEALRAGKDPGVVAASLGRGRQTVNNWWHRYRTFATLGELELALDPEDTRYVQAMRRLFELKWKRDGKGFEWKREDLTEIATELGFPAPKNLGDNIYSIRHGREDLPEEIRNLAPAGKAWLLLPNGKSAYRFVLAERAFLDPDSSKQPIKIPDSTPQLVARYAKRDEQAVLARIRYCRLVDIFMGLASFQLQSHMRTTIAHFNGAQTELDEVYVGVDGNGSQFVIPIQAKGQYDRIGAVQIVTDSYAVAEKFPSMIPRTLAAKMLGMELGSGGEEVYTIALIESTVAPGYNVRKLREEHFQLVPASQITDDDLASYRRRYKPASALKG